MTLFDRFVWWIARHTGATFRLRTWRDVREIPCPYPVDCGWVHSEVNGQYTSTTIRWRRVR